jgi:hypothetical protein
MTSKDVLKLKMIKALIEAIDGSEDDEDEAKQALKMIRDLVAAEKA